MGDVPDQDWRLVSQEKHPQNATGYSTADESRWICRRCFDDFRVRFNWHVAD